MNTKVVVRHFHEGNDADRRIRDLAVSNGKAKCVYATYAKIIDLDTGEILHHVIKLGPNEEMVEPVQVWAFCRENDVPSRKQGRAIAIGRLQKQFPDECAKADFGVFKNLKV